MAKYLRVNPDYDYENDRLTGVNWRLPADVNLDVLADNVSEALRSGESVTVEVEMSDTPLNRAYVVINGSLIASVVIAETPDVE